MKLAPRTLAELAARYGGEVEGNNASLSVVTRIAPISAAQSGELAPLLARRFVRDAVLAHGRGAHLLVSAELARSAEISSLARTRGVWSHPFAAWALSEVLDACEPPNEEARVGTGCTIGANVVLYPNVTLGDRVTVGAGSVIGRPGFGWATGAGGKVRAIPQLGGVVLEDDVVIGPLSTVDAGTLAPTRIRRGAKLDAQCHVAHNCDIGEDAIIAAQSGFAGSVTVGRGVLVGGQVGIADHVTVGDFAKIAAKSGVIGDVPAGAVVAGYPAVPRQQWLRALAHLYRGIRREPSKATS